MRSRYSAYVVRDEAYLLRSWSPANRPRRVQFDDDLRWTGLEIFGRTGGSAFHTDGTVEFRARFEHDGQLGEHRENSAFLRVDGAWVYDRAVSEP
jgi:SEC-C motif-containing protein